jgi:hypothetical protein
MLTGHKRQRVATTIRPRWRARSPAGTAFVAILLVCLDDTRE